MNIMWIELCRLISSAWKESALDSVCITLIFIDFFFNLCTEAFVHYHFDCVQVPSDIQCNDNQSGVQVSSFPLQKMALTD